MTNVINDIYAFSSSSLSNVIDINGETKTKTIYFFFNVLTIAVENFCTSTSLHWTKRKTITKECEIYMIIQRVCHFRTTHQSGRKNTPFGFAFFSFNQRKFIAYLFFFAKLFLLYRVIFRMMKKWVWTMVQTTDQNKMKVKEMVTIYLAFEWQT